MGNFISGIVLLYKPQKSLHHSINLARLYNSYESLFELILSIINFSVFSTTNQRFLIKFYFLYRFGNLFTNYLVHISHSKRFIFNIILNFALIICIFVLQFLLMDRTLKFKRICQLISDFYIRHPELNNDNEKNCSYQSLLYQVWFVLELISNLLKFVSIFLAYKANIIVKKEIILKRKKRKNKK